MRQNRQKTWFLLGYLVLLLNLGPSLHRAQFFGLHSHGGSCCHHHGDLQTTHGHASDDHLKHSHCHDHAHHDCSAGSALVALQSLSTQSLASSGLSDGTDAAAHDCLFCKFFEHYQATPVSIELPTCVSPFLFMLAECQSSVHRLAVLAIARGPPMIAAN